MSKAILILGGARSGKSRRALALAEGVGPQRLFVATAEALDDEMSARIDRHQQERGEGWSTIEAPLDIVTVLNQAQSDVVLMDCLTLWLSNLVHYDRDIESETSRLCEAITDCAIPTVLVSNEIGLGLVPETPLGREFRDAQGRLNQRVAAACGTVEFVAAGLPITLKGQGLA